MRFAYEPAFRNKALYVMCEAIWVHQTKQA